MIADPHDRTAWSALADCLTERGDPRGEFMQVQRALEDETIPADQRKTLRAREEELLAAHEKEWIGDWAELYPAATRAPRAARAHQLTGRRKHEFKCGLLTTVYFGEL